MSAERLPNESPEYRKLRSELLEAEIALRDQREKVAELRRRLPRDTRLETDYVFQEGPADLSAGDAPLREVRLADLFERPEHSLILMHFMFGGAQADPCQMCTMWADGYDGVVPHIRENANFAVVVAGDLARIRGYARERGWRNLRLLSSQGTSFKRDLHMEDEEGRQEPGVSVFTLGEDGSPRHFYTGGALMAPEQYRGMDLLSPVWNFLDLTPEGRGKWFPSRVYED